MRQRRGVGGRMSGIAGDVAAAVRRRQSDREPRVVVYDQAGMAHVLAPADEGVDAVLEAAEEMIAMVGALPAEEPAAAEGPEEPAE